MLCFFNGLSNSLSHLSHTLISEITGWDSSKKVTIEDCEDEERDVFIEDMFKSGLPDTFSCMELKAELEDYLYLPNSNAGIVEEVPDGEERIIKIMVSRNVSIVSVSEDESSIKNTPCLLYTSRCV